MNLQMLGTGNAFAKKYYNNNALIQIKDHSLLIDCGITAPIALYKSGRTVNDLDAILITHLHADHIGGLEEFAFATKFVHKKKLPLFIPSSLIYPLWENSLRAGLQDMEGAHSLESYFHVIPLEEGRSTETIPGLNVEMIQTEHVPQKLSYSLFLNETVFYSSDVKFNSKLVEQVYFDRKCKYILHDCQLDQPPTVHATLHQLLTLPEEIQNHIFLMHYGDNKNDYIGRTGKMKFIEQQKDYNFN